MIDIVFCVSWSDYVSTVNEKLTHYIKDGFFKSASCSLEVCVDEDVTKKIGFPFVVEEAMSQVKAQIRALGKDDSGVSVEYKDTTYEAVAGDKARYAIITDNGVKVMVVSNLLTKLKMHNYPVLDSLFRRVCEALTELMRTECRTENLERWKHKEDVVKLCVQRTVNHELAYFAKNNLEYSVSPSSFVYAWDIEYQGQKFTLSLDLDLFLGTIKVYILDVSDHNKVMTSETLEFEKINEHNN